MKERLKGFTVGIVTMTMLLAAVPAFGATATKTVSIAYKNIKLYFDGKEFTPKPGNEPFVMNGGVYLPLRAVGDALDTTVTWDGEKNIAYFGKEAGNTTPDVWLYNMKPFEGVSRVIVDTYDNTGVYHKYSSEIQKTKYYKSGDRKLTTSFLLDQKYKRFQGGFALRNDCKNTESKLVYEVYGDGYLLYASPGLQRGSLPEEFNIDVSGIKVLTICALQTEPYINASSANCIVVDAGFYK